MIRVALVDLRRSSPTRGASQTLEIGEDNLMGVFVPIGIAHGFVALSDATLTYLVDNYYDGSDELGVAWNDPALGVAWDISNPVLSPRDVQNPLLKDIPRHQLPD
jgi:dTDP-4-dehydrorhamnose 3,5-epimerase